MATMIPDPPLEFHGSPGEQAVYEALRTLPDGVHVFHSLRWIRTPGMRAAREGESDFLVFDPDGRGRRDLRVHRQREGAAKLIRLGAGVGWTALKHRHVGQPVDIPAIYQSRCSK